MVKSTADKIIKISRQTLNIEIDGLKNQLNHLTADFIKTVELMLHCPGRIVFMGIGKAGIIGRKMAATFSSVGIPSLFVYPVELLHGDLGMISLNDILFVLSYSGESDELKKVVPLLKEMKFKIVLMTGRTDSKIGKLCDYVINVNVSKEACPFNLAPTASTTAMLAMGDAIALSVSGIKGFKREDYARFHPGGSIGKKLLMLVKEVMHSGEENPVINKNKSVRDALFVMTEKKFGAVSVVDNNNKLAGYFTDGDLRRKLQSDKMLLDKKISEVMTVNPKTATVDMLAYESAELMKKYNCDNLPVVDKSGKPVGMVDERDLISAGII